MSAALLLAATMFSGEIPEAERAKRLKPFFSPRPGAIAHLSEHDMRDYGPGISPMEMRGQIVVKPPPGVCFTIARSESEEDVIVCKETQLSFVLNDLDNLGRLHWDVATADGDFGTELIWDTPYRVALVEPPPSYEEEKARAKEQEKGKDKDSDKDKAKPPPPPPPLEHKFVDSCTPIKDETGRRIQVHLLTGETWVIRFPPVDTMLPQPRSVSNLEAIVSVGKIGVGDAAEAQKADEAQTKQDAAEKSEKGEAAPAPNGKAEPVPYERDDRKEWAIPLRDAYSMSSDYFQPHGSVTPGLKGRCRYLFAGSKDDPEIGRLECHDVDGFASVYVPLTCLRQIGPLK